MRKELDGREGLAALGGDATGFQPDVISYIAAICACRKGWMADLALQILR